MTPEALFHPVFREIPYLDPHIAYEKVRSGQGFLFESVRGPERIARYSFIGLNPYTIFRLKDGEIEIDHMGRKTISSRKPLERLRELVGSYRQAREPGLPPFQGGAAGILSYDFVQYLEMLPRTAVDDLGVPDAHFFLIDQVIAFDHAQRRAWVIVCPGARDTELGFSDPGDRRERAISDAGLTADAIAAQIAVSRGTLPEQAAGYPDVRIVSETPKGRYLSMVRAAKEYIAAGDIFQANLSLRVSAETGDVDPWEIYKVLRSVNPSPFALFMDFGDYQIVSSSPERLVRSDGELIDTRPIAGTRPRGRDQEQDESLRAELLLNEKERAEHIMLIDLERNDIGRVADYGSVCVDELMITENYSHVIHIVSNVCGRLAAGKDNFDVIRAVFPGGTITGVPKVRCMEIIDELEPTRRGPYTGSVGYIGFNGTMDLNIVIRTFLVKEGKAHVQAGAGIVADSDPEREYAECLKKAEALIRTLELIRGPHQGRAT